MRRKTEAVRSALRTASPFLGEGLKISLAAALAAVALAAGASAAFAQSAPSPSPSPAPSASPSPTATPRDWVTSGSIDTSYSSFSSPNVGYRVFDTQSKQPMLNAITLQLQKNGTIGGKLGITAGSNADIIASYPDQNNDGFDVTNAYLSFTGGPLTLIGGKFSTLAGAEVIEGPGNADISRSFLFGLAVPFTHTGLRLSYAPTPVLTLIAGVNNGWDNLKGSSTGSKTIELGAAYNGPVVALAAQGYSGTERITYAPYSAASGRRTLLDVVGTWHASPALTLVGNFDGGKQANAPVLDAAGTTIAAAGTPTWNGVAGYATYQFTPKFSATVRGETFSDVGGYRTGFDQRLREGTLTLGYAPSAPLVVRLEVRADQSNRAVFTDSAGAAKNTQSSVGAQVLVKF